MKKTDEEAKNEKANKKEIPSVVPPVSERQIQEFTFATLRFTSVLLHSDN